MEICACMERLSTGGNNFLDHKNIAWDCNVIMAHFTLTAHTLRMHQL